MTPKRHVYCNGSNGQPHVIINDSYEIMPGGIALCESCIDLLLDSASHTSAVDSDRSMYGRLSRGTYQEEREELEDA